jgi:Domain of unknown function (DUF4336)
MDAAVVCLPQAGGVWCCRFSFSFRPRCSTRLIRSTCWSGPSPSTHSTQCLPCESQPAALFCASCLGQAGAGRASRASGRSSGRLSVTGTNGTRLVLFGVQNRAVGPFLAAMHRVPLRARIALRAQVERLIVSPVVKELVFSNVPGEASRWIESIARDWPFRQIIPCHFRAPIAAGPKDLRQAGARPLSPQ